MLDDLVLDDTPTRQARHALTKHAWRQMDDRRLPRQAVAAALSFGRVVHTRGAAIHALGRKEIERHRHHGLDLRPYEAYRSSARRRRGANGLPQPRLPRPATAAAHPL